MVGIDNMVYHMTVELQSYRGHRMWELRSLQNEVLHSLWHLQY
jgi:hypothetical protein